MSEREHDLFLLPPDRFPRGLTEDQLRKQYGDNTDEVLAYRRFLQVVDSAPIVQGGHRKIGPVWLAYAKGQISGTEALRRDSSF